MIRLDCKYNLDKILNSVSYKLLKKTNVLQFLVEKNNLLMHLLKVNARATKASKTSKMLQAI